MKMRIASLAAVLIYIASVSLAEAGVMRKLFQADTMPWTVLVFVVGLVVGAIIIHLIRRNRGP
jgi:uncharacterized membrane protein YraQ (UPF0718 family)